MPLKTNLELVSYLKSIEPANITPREKMNEVKRERYSYVWQIEKIPRSNQKWYGEYKKRPSQTNIKKSPPPGNITLYAGLAYIIATREFIHWTLTDPFVQEIISWSKNSFSSDEMLWASISMLENAPGRLE